MVHAGASPLCPDLRVLRWSCTSNPIQIYFATRLAALGGVCAELVGFNLTAHFNCQAWLLSVLVRRFPFCSTPLCQWGLRSGQINCYLAYALNSLLILLRTCVMAPPLITNPLYQPLFVLALYRRVAVWGRRPVISVPLTAVWLTNVAFLIHGARLSPLACYNALTPSRLLGIAIVRRCGLFLTAPGD